MNTSNHPSGLTDEQYEEALNDISRSQNLLHMEIDLHHHGRLSQKNRDFICVHDLIQDIYGRLYQRRLYQRQRKRDNDK